MVIVDEPEIEGVFYCKVAGQVEDNLEDESSDVDADREAAATAAAAEQKEPTPEPPKSPTPLPPEARFSTDKSST